ncbi:hypothetical protein Ddye_021209 [Dipteronia dyeriana]|uniref:Retrotransposon gag domain-containing protein n=1 Tax=Dipteronia dyeriana TaxID=168575 RepID=A0AAD9U169_9ROSI|nr:hypothetical protein Ddye_021209 [Dipteronia dyeriana]
MKLLHSHEFPSWYLGTTIMSCYPIEVRILPYRMKKVTRKSSNDIDQAPHYWDGVSRHIAISTGQAPPYQGGTLSIDRHFEVPCHITWQCLKKAQSKEKKLKHPNPVPVPVNTAQALAPPVLSQSVLDQQAGPFVKNVRLQLVAEGITPQSVGPRTWKDPNRSGVRTTTFDRRNDRGNPPQEDNRGDDPISSEGLDSESSEVVFKNVGRKCLRDQIDQMQKEIQKLKNGKQNEDRKDPLGEIKAHFSRRIREAELQLKFKMLAKKFSSIEDPLIHLESYVQRMEVQNATWAAMCRMFLTALTDYAKTWFRKLPPSSVDSFTKLSSDFCS